MKKPLETAWMCLKVVQGWFSSHQGMANKGVSQLHRDSDVVGTYICTQGRGGLKKETMASASSSVQEKVASASPLPSHTTFPHCMSLPPLQLLPQHWSSGPVILSVSES